MHAVLLEVRPGRILRDSLVHAVCLDQAQERLSRQVAGANRALQLPRHRPGRLAGVTGVDLALELVEDLEPVPLVFIAEDVDEPGEAVDRA